MGRPEAFQFIIDELMSSDRVPIVAQHKFGCRIVRRLLGFCRADQVCDLVQALLSEAVSLLRNTFGTYVIQHVLEYACIEDQRSLVDLLVEHASDVCSSNVSCMVIDTFLSTRNSEECLALAYAILKQEALTKMARSRNGTQALRAILKLLEGSFECDVAREQLLASKDSLNKTRYGRSILKTIEEKAGSGTCSMSSALSRPSVSSAQLRQEATRRMSWADMSSDTEEDFF